MALDAEEYAGGNPRWRWHCPDWPALLDPLELALQNGKATIELAARVYFDELADCTEPLVLARAADIFEALRDCRPVPAPQAFQRERYHDALLLTFPHRATAPRASQLPVGKGRWRLRAEPDFAAEEFANTDPNRSRTLLGKAKSGEDSKGLERNGNKPLMRNRTANEEPIPTGSIPSNNFMNKNSLEIGHRLREARKAAGWDGYGMVPACAAAAGIGRSVLNSVECGVHAGPTIAKLVAFLHINPAWLETGEGEMFTAPPPRPGGVALPQSPAAVAPTAFVGADVGERPAAAGDDLQARLSAAVAEFSAAKTAFLKAQERMNAVFEEIKNAA